eukprot:TRINITY_DN3106_c0_g1_i5.p1 TRINITY_DN3106_c0_g1~~TRINITY_DN3106_c0_g1_i5.p1  ORF type:complete len:224 (+),score=-18.04 TRINITY_DN3106_c0_g1_i5:442-1113(+)
MLGRKKSNQNIQIQPFNIQPKKTKFLLFSLQSKKNMLEKKIQKYITHKKYYLIKEKRIQSLLMILLHKINPIFYANLQKLYFSPYQFFHFQEYYKKFHLKKFEFTFVFTLCIKIWQQVYIKIFSFKYQQELDICCMQNYRGIPAINIYVHMHKRICMQVRKGIILTQYLKQIQFDVLVYTQRYNTTILLNKFGIYMHTCTLQKKIKNNILSSTNGIFGIHIRI